jgi:putative tryptophan/tyrosine transport system substrate-binding protein
MIIGLLAVPLSARAQPAGKIPRIGYLSQRSGPSPLDEAFREGLRELGYIEGTNLAVEYRWAGFNQDRLLALARDLVALKVDLIVATGGTATARAAKSVTSTTPILFTGGDPVGTGVVQSLARPGGNATGVTLFTSELSAKRLALLKETLPTIGRVAVLSNPANPFREQQLKDTKDAATALGLELHIEEVRDPPGIERAFSLLTRKRADALLVFADPMLIEQRDRIVKLAARSRIPAIYEVRDSTSCNPTSTSAARRS